MGDGMPRLIGSYECITPGCQTRVFGRDEKCRVCAAVESEAFDKGYLEALRDCETMTISLSLDRLRAFIQNYIRRVETKTKGR